MPNIINPFTDAHTGTPTLTQTRHFAAFKHKDQKDPNLPYIHHLARVAQNVLRLDPNADEKTIMIAWLHDLIEDKKATLSELQKRNFPKDVITALKRLDFSHKDGRSYNKKIKDLIATGDKRAILVKLADNMDNMHPQRVEEFMQRNPKKRINLTERYCESITLLCDALGYDVLDIDLMIEHAPPIGFNAAQKISPPNIDKH